MSSPEKRFAEKALRGKGARAEITGLGVEHRCTDTGEEKAHGRGKVARAESTGLGVEHRSIDTSEEKLHWQKAQAWGLSSGT